MWSGQLRPQRPWGAASLEHPRRSKGAAPTRGGTPAAAPGAPGRGESKGCLRLPSQRFSTVHAWPRPGVCAAQSRRAPVVPLCCRWRWYGASCAPAEPHALPDAGSCHPAHTPVPALGPRASREAHYQPQGSASLGTARSLRCPRSPLSPWTLGVDLAFLSSQELGHCPGGCPAPASWDSGLAPRAPLSFLWGLLPALPGCLVVCG